MARRKTVQEKLTETLEAMGYRVQQLIPLPRGGIRRWRSRDDTTTTWSAWLRRSGCPLSFDVQSYDTMTACVRRGLDIRDEGRHGWWAYANEPAMSDAVLRWKRQEDGSYEAKHAGVTYCVRAGMASGHRRRTSGRVWYAWDDEHGSHGHRGTKREAQDACERAARGER